MEKKTHGHILVEMLIDRGYTREALAESWNLSKHAIYSFNQKGRQTFTLDELVSAARLFGFDSIDALVDEIYYRSGKTPPGLGRKDDQKNNDTIRFVIEVPTSKKDQIKNPRFRNALDAAFEELKNMEDEDQETDGSK